MLDERLTEAEMKEREAWRRVDRAALVGFCFGAVVMLVAIIWAGGLC